MAAMQKRTVMGVYAPPPRLTAPVLSGLGALLLVVIIAAGLALDPLFRWLLGLG